MIDEATYRRTQSVERSTARYNSGNMGVASSDEDEPSSDMDIGECVVTPKRPHANKQVSQSRRFTLSPPAMLIAPDRGELISPDQLDFTQQEGDLYQFKAVQAEGTPEEVVLMSCQQEVNGFSLQQKSWSESPFPPQDSTTNPFYVYVKIFSISSEKKLRCLHPQLLYKLLVEPKSV